MATARDNNAFAERLLVSWPLDEAIDYIKGNLNPQDVFDERDLREWALENGFVEEATP